MGKLIAVAFCLLVSIANADELPEPVRESAANTVFVQDGPYRGSGVYLGDGLYLSAWHVVENNDGRKITVTKPKGDVYSVSILATDKESDIALLESVDKPAGGVQVASDEVAKGTEVYHAGLAKGKIVAWRGSVVSYGSRGVGGSISWAFTRGVRAAIPGDSGGPVFDARGRLLGPLWGGVVQTRETVFSRPTRTLAILSPYSVRLNVWHGVSE